MTARTSIGIALDGDPERRLVDHLYGHGRPLVRAVVAAGIRVDLVLAVPGDRSLERRWHNRHGTRVCPRCRSQRAPRPRQLHLQTRQPAPTMGWRSLPQWRLAMQPESLSVGRIFWYLSLCVRWIQP